MAEYIGKETALMELCRGCSLHGIGDSFFCGEPCPKYERIASIPAADVAPVRHGRWYRFQKVYIDPQSGFGFGKDMYKCDACKVGEEETRKPYCPECGAKVDKKDTDAEKSD